MTRFIVPVILIGIAVAFFLTFANPLYRDTALLRAQAASYDEALGNSKALEVERNTLTQKYNAMNPDDLLKLQKLLPENIDNIRLILEIEKIASPYGMVLKDVKYSTAEKKDSKAFERAAGAVQGRVAEKASKDYGVWDLEFSTSGSYNNFFNFTRDLENNLRIVDISSITFLSNPDTRFTSALPEIYKYDFKIKTYWLKK